MEDMKRLIEELEKENRRLKESEEKQKLGKNVLVYLQIGGRTDDDVIRAMKDVQEKYYAFECSFDPERQKRVISYVEALRGKISTCTTVRNIAGGAGIASAVIQMLCLTNPVGWLVMGLNTATFVFLHANARQDIESSTKEVERILRTDAERFGCLAKAVEELDKLWQDKFCFSIHSEKFREICSQSDSTLNASNSTLRSILMWFGVNEKWANINVAVSSHYMFAAVGAIGIISGELATGLLCISQLFLLINDLCNDGHRMAVIDQGITRMKEQYRVMLELKGK